LCAAAGNPITVVEITEIPRARTDQEPRTGFIDGWLDPPRHDDAGADVDGDYLRAIAALDTAGAPEREVINAVKAAKDNGWSWTPIAMVLGTTRRQVLERFSRAIGHPVSGRRAWR
jgi:hypothetical protein